MLKFPFCKKNVLESSRKIPLCILSQKDYSLRKILWLNYWVFLAFRPCHASHVDKCCVIVWIYKELWVSALKYFRIRNFWNIDSSSYFENPKKPMIFMKESAKKKKKKKTNGQFFDLFIYFRTMVTYKTHLFEYLENWWKSWYNWWVSIFTRSKNRPNTDDASKSSDIWTKNPSMLYSWEDLLPKGPP